MYCIDCSTGTGRTGTLLALDICMKAYEDNRTIDIMNTVHKLRLERAGAVNTTAHYAFIYKVSSTTDYRPYFFPS